MRKALFLLGMVVFAFGMVMAQSSTQGTLRAATKKGVVLGDCPLKTTTVKVDVSGFLSRVRVRQEFENSFTEPIEAVYTFPLSQTSAVDDMTMFIGERVIKGKIMKREEARQVYETAKSEGKTASLLDQERPNIFTQSVANIMPGERIVIEISYVETLKYEDGAYEFVFPMTVGPRYNPASVKDAAAVSPPVVLAERSGHDISIEVNLNAGVPVEDVRSTSHEIEAVRADAARARITLKNDRVIPNKDFILRYDVTGKKIWDAVLTHRDERGGFFTLILQPPDKFVTEDRTPKEIVFVLDTSGSMSGFPIEKAKEAMRLSLDGLYPDDTFNLITFAGETSILFDGPVPATQANIETAQEFLAGHSGGGGTEMMKAVRAALDPSDAKDHVRIVCFMTDGYVGNEEEIIAEVKKHQNARVFSFGIGSSVNRYLLDKMAEAGRGEVEYVALTDDGSLAARRFYERVRTPLLTDLSVDWNGIPVSDVYPSRVPDLFSAKPVILHGRYGKAVSGSIKLRGFVAGQPYEREIAVNFPESEAANDSLASLWARTRVDDLSSAKLAPANSARAAEFDKQITGLGLEYRLMTQFTSFVAVEDKVINRNGKPVTVQVPVALPEGVDPSKVGVQESVSVMAGQPSAIPVNGRAVSGLYMISGGVVNRSPSTKSKQRRASGSGTGYGSGSGSGSGYGMGAPTAMPKTTSPLTPINLVTPSTEPVGPSNSGDRIVVVEVMIDVTGKVNKATAISGSPNLKSLAENAARESTFSPAKINGVPVANTTYIKYDFANLGKPVIADSKDAWPSPESIRDKGLKVKMHTWVYTLMKRVDEKKKPADNEAYFVKDGKAGLRVTLKSISPEVIEKLKAVGFEIVAEPKGNIVTGRIAIEKLAALAEIDEVVLVLPKV